MASKGDIYICLAHLHPVTNGRVSRNDCVSHWLKNGELPEKFVIGTRSILKRYKLASYRKLQKQHRADTSMAAQYSGNPVLLHDELGLVRLDLVRLG